jgi:hypothetical protein
MTTALLILGAVVLGACAVWLGRRDAARLGRETERAEARRKAIRDATKADEIRRAVKRGAGRERLRRFDRD